MLNAPQILFDFSYESIMSKRLMCYTAGHFTHFFASNRKDPQPFDVHICNADPNQRCLQELQKRIPRLLESDSTVMVHRECFSELYPHEKLLYLSPYSPNILREYDPNDVYVIGGVVDLGFHGAVTMSRAKQLGIRTAWLPIHRYMDVGDHAQKLPLNIVGDIMRDLKNTRNWEKAFVHIPQRKRKPSRQERHKLHEIIAEATNLSGEMPKISWNDIRDQTRAMDDASARGMPNPFKKVTDEEAQDANAQAKRTRMLNPFK